MHADRYQYELSCCTHTQYARKVQKALLASSFMHAPSLKRGSLSIDRSRETQTDVYYLNGINVGPHALESPLRARLNAGLSNSSAGLESMPHSLGISLSPSTCLPDPRYQVQKSVL